MTDGEVTFQVEFNIDNDKNIEKLLQIRIIDFVLFSTSHITLVFLLESLSEKRVTGTDSSIPENLKKKKFFRSLHTEKVRFPYMPKFTKNKVCI